MIIETKEVITLTNEEKKMINGTYMLMCEIMEKTHDNELYKVVRNIANFTEQFGYIVDCETDK